MTISAKEVQELRKISGAGMMECKVALSDAQGDVDLAFKLLREKGIAKAEKKASRDANEGLIGIKVEGNVAVIIEINSETDFVSRNEVFHKLVNSVLDLSIKNNEDQEKIKSLSRDLINEAVGKIGENIVLRRFSIMRGNIHSYIHNTVNNGMGKIGVLINIQSNSDIEQIGKNICMHVAALNPKSISKEDLDQNIINSEKEIIIQQLKDLGKPDNILNKMIEGKLNKFYEESTLLNQKFVINPTISVEQYLKDSSSEVKSDITVKDFIRFEIGS